MEAFDVGNIEYTAYTGKLNASIIDNANVVINDIHNKVAIDAKIMERFVEYLYKMFDMKYRKAHDISHRKKVSEICRYANPKYYYEELIKQVNNISNMLKGDSLIDTYNYGISRMFNCQIADKIAKRYLLSDQRLNKILCLALNPINDYHKISKEYIESYKEFIDYVKKNSGFSSRAKAVGVVAGIATAVGAMALPGPSCGSASKLGNAASSGIGKWVDEVDFGKAFGEVERILYNKFRDHYINHVKIVNAINNRTHAIISYTIYEVVCRIQKDLEEVGRSLLMYKEDKLILDLTENQKKDICTKIEVLNDKACEKLKDSDYGETIKISTALLDYITSDSSRIKLVNKDNISYAVLVASIRGVACYRYANELWHDNKCAEAAKYYHLLIDGSIVASDANNDDDMLLIASCRLAIAGHIITDALNPYYYPITAFVNQYLVRQGYDGYTVSGEYVSTKTYLIYEIINKYAYKMNIKIDYENKLPKAIIQSKVYSENNKEIIVKNERTNRFSDKYMLWKVLMKEDANNIFVIWCKRYIYIPVAIKLISIVIICGLVVSIMF